MTKLFIVLLTSSAPKGKIFQVIARKTLRNIFCFNWNGESKLCKTHTFYSPLFIWSTEKWRFLNAKVVLCFHKSLYSVVLNNAVLLLVFNKRNVIDPSMTQTLVCAAAFSKVKWIAIPRTALVECSHCWNNTHMLHGHWLMKKQCWSIQA